MANSLTADDILPLIKHLTLEEQVRLIRLIIASGGGDAAAYSVIPPESNEFSSDADHLAWDADGWDLTPGR